MVYIEHTERQHLKRIYILYANFLFSFFLHFLSSLSLSLSFAFSPTNRIYIYIFLSPHCRFILSLSLTLSLSLSDFTLAHHFTPARVMCTGGAVSGAPRNECLGFLFLLFGPQPYFCLFYLFIYFYL